MPQVEQKGAQSDAAGKEGFERVVQETLVWLDSNRLAGEDEFEAKRKDLAARRKALEETRQKAEEEARMKAEEDIPLWCFGGILESTARVRLKEEEDARMKAAEEARQKAEEARLKAEEDAKKKEEE